MKRLIASLVLGLIWASFGSLADAQSLTTGAITGTVVDQSGAAMARVLVTAKNVDTGAMRETQTTGSGNFLLAQLDPGRYEVTAEYNGFERTEIGPITVAVSRIAPLEFRLKIGSATATVEVKQEAPLIETANPNTTTTFNSQQLANLPNPGNDLTYVVNLTPGAIMHTSQSGGHVFGNSEVNGQSSLANDVTIDGLDANNPGVSTNLTGPSGLQLGLNAIQEVTVNSSPYSVAGGRTSGSHIELVTKSGTNSFHGNLYEVWNGSVMNANNYFLNANGQHRPRTNVNQFGASVGGPIIKDKLHFFTDVEGIRLVLSQVVGTTLPTPAYQSYVLQQLPLGGQDSLGIALPPEPAEVPFYQQMFSLLGDTSRGNPLAAFGCPFDVGGGNPATPGAGNGCANTRVFSLAPPTSETLFTIKLDYNQSSQNSYWFRFQSNDGSHFQDDPVNSVFNTVSPVSVRQGAAGWTHILGSNLVNQFNPGISYQSNVLKGTTAAKALAALPITYFATPFTAIGGSQFFLPSGSAQTVWQLNDNLIWTTGKHSFQFGENLRRVLVSLSQATGAVPEEFTCSLQEFTYGAACQSLQTFSNGGNRLANVNLDLYAMDNVRATPKLTLTAGLRVAWNSDPVSESDQFSWLNGSFATIPHDVNRPLNLDILPSQANLWGSTPLLIWEPRAAVAYQFAKATVARVGFGVFTNPPDLNQYSQNPPSAYQVIAGPFSSVGGIAIAPSVPGSLVDAAVAANQRFQQNFSNGGLSCASPQATPSTCISPFLFIDRPRTRHEYPYSMEWSAGIERALGRNAALLFKYVGTRTVKGGYNTDENSFQTFCNGCFAPLPFRTPVDTRFGPVMIERSGANSSYHALQITAQKRLSQGLTFQANYTYSHCLDLQSNGGSYNFSLSSLSVHPVFPGGYYGNCDYDVRHSVNGSYLYELPFHSATWVNHVIGGWQISGTVFLRGGFPISVLSVPPPARIRNGSAGGIFANLIPGQDPYSKSNIPGVTQPGTIQWLNPNAFQSVINPQTRSSCYPSNTPQNCQQGDLSRNALRAPDFRWADLSITKSFRLTERVALKVDAQFYNLFNHPNFGVPSKLSAGIPGVPSFASSLANFGTISTTVSPATGLLGSGLGGDSSVRIIALRGRIEF